MGPIISPNLTFSRRAHVVLESSTLARIEVAPNLVEHDSDWRIRALFHCDRERCVIDHTEWWQLDSLPSLDASEEFVFSKQRPGATTADPNMRLPRLVPGVPECAIKESAKVIVFHS